MKVFFFDVDGTMIDAKNGIYNPTEKTKVSIEKLKKLGHKVILATGRPKCILSDEIKALGFDGYITSNGADVTIGEEQIFQFVLDEKMVLSLLDNEQNYHYEVVFESENYLHGRYPENGVFNDLINKYKLSRDTIIKDFNYDLYKAQILFKEDEFKEEYFNKVSNLIGDNYLVGYENYYFDVLNDKLNKGLGVIKVKEYYNLDEEDYYAFGDGMNDLQMMNNVYHSVCMNNGHEKIKEISRYITKEVENEGVYYFLKENNII